MNLRRPAYMLVCAVASAQSQDAITNETIMRMAAAGVPASAMIQTVNAASSVAFRFLPGDLAALSQAKVPEDVIKAMSARSNNRNPPAPLAQTQARTLAPAAATPSPILTPFGLPRSRRRHDLVASAPEP